MSSSSDQLDTARLKGAPWRVAPGRRALERLLRRLQIGRLTVELPSGERAVGHGALPGPDAVLVIHRWRALTRIALKGEVGFAEAFLHGDLSSPCLPAMLELAVANETHAFDTPPSGFAPMRLFNWLQHRLNANSRRGSRRNISAHYDLGNSFYERWLDPSMTYSSALYATPNQTLEDAQIHKLERIAELLDVDGGKSTPEKSVLEIGCGWGALAQHLVAKHNCTVTGLTLSTEQLQHAKERTADLGARVDLRLQDYRDVTGQFDRIVSIEMIEAVGEKYWPVYFNTIRARLKVGGKAVIQAITIDEKRFEDYRSRPDFIQRYIFPGGMLPTVEILRAEAERAGLRLVKMEHFGESYARNLEEWRIRFHAAWPSIAPLGFDDRFRRMWDYYLAYCEAGFRIGTVDVGLYVIEG